MAKVKTSKAAKTPKTPTVTYVVFKKADLSRLVFKDGSRVKWESETHGRITTRNAKGQFQSEGFRVARAA